MYTVIVVEKPTRDVFDKDSLTRWLATNINSLTKTHKGTLVSSQIINHTIRTTRHIVTISINK
jgi:hypothetical protein